MAICSGPDRVNKSGLCSFKLANLSANVSCRQFQTAVMACSSRARLLEETKTVLGRAKKKLRNVIADTQYSDEKLRAIVGEAVIPYPANQKRGVKDLLRVDKKFRTYARALKTRRMSTISVLALKR